MLPQDLQALLDRLDRVSRAIDIGCGSLHQRPQPMVSSTLVEATWESIRLGHQLIGQLAYDDLWGDLQLLLQRWQAIEEQAHAVRVLAVSSADVTDVAGAVVGSLKAMITAVGAIDAAQVEVTARPRDARAVLRAIDAIRAMEEAADCFFMAAVTQDRQGRLDAAMALLTAVAARGARERTAVSSRRG